MIGLIDNQVRVRRSLFLRKAAQACVAIPIGSSIAVHSNATRFVSNRAPLAGARIELLGAMLSYRVSDENPVGLP